VNGTRPADLEKVCRPDAILSTNTSTIDIDLVGAKMEAGGAKSAGRLLGAHFFSPAHVMPLLEIVRTSRTSPQVGGFVSSQSRKRASI
jgi:enoyl-CoA hydratase/3-hydroxyacyl-CoA dehydrogenase